jgi:L-2,4-diaminobutyrate decarboxylase
VFETAFLTRDDASRAAYRRAIEHAVSTLERALPDRPYSGKSPTELAELLAGELCPAHGKELAEVLRRAEAVVRHSVVVTHPHTAAHLHCPPLLAALAAEVLISALNQSMDSFDQAPAATVLEQSLVRRLCRQAQLPDTAGGTFTAGGTQSNYTGLWLARDAYLRKHHGWSAQEQGLPADARRFRFLCSEAAHFTVEKSAAQLGLGTQAVIRVAVDGAFRMCVRDLRARLESLGSQGLCPVAVVATAGTTDFGSIDPLVEVAELTKAHGAWFHVDAAYGGALLFSGRYASRLDGVERADSLTLDFHKLLWQPISCGAFLVRDAAHFDLVKLHADYLNPEDHENQGIPDLVTRSVLTSRRFDALKLWVSLQVLGREQLAQMIDRTLDLAQQAADLIRAQPRLKLLHRPELGCVVFRYRSEDGDSEDALNERIRRDLFDRGQAVVGHTRVSGRKCLKWTLLNPTTTPDEIAGLLEQIVRHGEMLERGFCRPDCSGAAVGLPGE